MTLLPRWARSAFATLERFAGIDLRYLFKGATLLAGSEALVSLISLGVAILMANYVSKDVYGIYRYIASIAAIAAAFSLTGMNSAVTRAVAAGREGAFLASLTTQARYAFLQFAVTAFAAAYYFYNQNEVYGYSLLAVAVLAPVAGVLNTYTAYLNGKRAFRTMASWKIQGGIVSAAAMASVVLASPTVIALTVAYFLSQAVVNAWCLLRTMRRYRPTRHPNMEDISYGKHLSIMNAVGTIATQIDAVIVYHLLGPVALATYSFAILIPERLRSLLSFLPNLALPKLATRSIGELRDTAGHRALLGLFASGGIAAMYAVVAPLLFSTFFPQYADAAGYSQLAGLFALAVVPTYLSTVLTSQGSKRALYLVSISAPILKTVLSVVCILTLGIWGAILARLLAGGFSGVVSYGLLVRSRDTSASVR